jgi:hypothetical protein
MLAFMNGDQEKLEAMTNDLAEKCTLRWTRNLYDWYTATWAKLGVGQNPPIILDADDILNNPDLILRFCELVGLDPTKVRFKWEAINKQDLANGDPIRQHSRATLFTSSGITKGKTFHGLSVDGEAAKWRDEFG